MSAEQTSRSKLPAGPFSRQTSELRSTVRICLVIGAIAGAVWVLYRIDGVLLLLAFSVLFAYLVAPVVGFFRRPASRFRLVRVLPVPLAIGAAYFVVFGTAVGAAILLLPVLDAQFREFRSELPGYVARFETGWQGWLRGQTRALPHDLRGAVDGIVRRAGDGMTRYLQEDLLPTVGNWLMHLPWLILVPILAFFLIKDGDQFRQSALNLFPGGSLRWRGEAFFRDVHRTLAAYIRAQVLAGLLMSAVCMTGFLSIGVPYGVTLGLAAGLLESLPLVGPLMIGVAAVVSAGLESSTRAVAVAAFLIVVRIAQDYMVYPKLVSRETRLHPMAVILAILCGGEIAGLPGIFISVPVLAVVTVAYRHWRAHRMAAPPRPVVA